MKSLLVDFGVDVVNWKGGAQRSAQEDCWVQRVGYLEVRVHAVATFCKPCSKTLQPFLLRSCVPRVIAFLNCSLLHRIPFCSLRVMC